MSAVNPQATSDPAAIDEAREIVGQPIVDSITGKDAAAAADTANTAFQKFLDDEK